MSGTIEKADYGYRAVTGADGLRISYRPEPLGLVAACQGFGGYLLVLFMVSMLVGSADFDLSGIGGYLVAATWVVVLIVPIVVVRRRRARRSVEREILLTATSLVVNGKQFARSDIVYVSPRDLGPTSSDSSAVVMRYGSNDVVVAHDLRHEVSIGLSDFLHRQIREAPSEVQTNLK